MEEGRGGGSVRERERGREREGGRKGGREGEREKEGFWAAEEESSDLRGRRGASLRRG